MTKGYSMVQLILSQEVYAMPKLLTVNAPRRHHLGRISSDTSQTLMRAVMRAVAMTSLQIT